MSFEGKKGGRQRQDTNFGQSQVTPFSIDCIALKKKNNQTHRTNFIYKIFTFVEMEENKKIGGGEDRKRERKGDNTVLFRQ